MKWIKLSDKLPEFNRRVLVYKTYHDIVEIALLMSRDQHGANWSTDYGHYITHWSYLPEPPKK